MVCLMSYVPLYAGNRMQNVKKNNKKKGMPKRPFSGHWRNVLFLHDD